jgi:hypothetical protein
MAFFTANTAITIVISWLMLSTLYPVLFHSPSSQQSIRRQYLQSLSQTSNSQTAQQPICQHSEPLVCPPPQIEIDDTNYQAALQEIESLRRVINKLKEQVHETSKLIPKPEDVIINVLPSECPKPEPCPPQPIYVLDEETNATINGIIDRQNQFLQFYQETKQSMDQLSLTLKETPTSFTCECESIEESKLEILKQVETTLNLTKTTQEHIDRLNSQLELQVAERKVEYEVFSDRLKQRVDYLSGVIDSDVDRVSQLIVSTAQDVYHHVSPIGDLIVRQKARNEDLVKRINDLVQRPKPTCPALPPTVTCPVCLQPNATVIEEAFHNALGQHIEILKQAMELEAIREKKQEDVAKEQYVPVSDSNNDNAPLDYALATSGAKVVYELTSPNFIPEELEIVRSFESTLKLVGLQRMSQTVLDALRVDYGVGAPTEALDQSTEPGRCWGMKVILFEKIVLSSIISNFHV